MCMLCIRCVYVTWAAERLLGRDASVAGGAEGGGGHGQGGEQVTIAVSGLPLSRLLLSLLQTLLFLVLNIHTHAQTHTHTHTQM